MFVLKLGRSARIEYLAFAPNGPGLAAAGDFGIALWPAIEAGLRATWFTSSSYCNTVRFTPDGRWLFGANWSELRRIDPNTGQSEVASPWGGWTRGFDVSPVESLVLIEQHGVGRPNSRLGLWQAVDLTPTGKIWEREVTGVTYHRPAFLPGGDRFATLDFYRVQPANRIACRITSHSAATGEPRRTVTAAVSSPYDWFISPDSRWAAMRGTNTIDLCPLDPDTDRVVTIRNTSKKFFTGAAFHPSGKYLAATSNDQTVKLYDTTTWEVARTFTWELGRMRSVCFSPDGTLAAAGSDKGQVVVWDVDV